MGKTKEVDKEGTYSGMTGLKNTNAAGHGVLPYRTSL